MSGLRCAMAPMVEADRDGRLDARDKGSLARHLDTCAECRQLRVQLDRLADLAVRRVLPDASPLEHQRRRAALLQRAAVGDAPVTMGEPPKPPAPPRPRLRVLALDANRVAIGLAAAAALVVGASLITREVRSVGAPAALARKLPAAPRVVDSLFETTVHADHGARYSRSRVGLLDRLDLEEGAVDLQVRHLGPGERFLVATADAEVEVRGTIFRVEAHDRRITAVSVREGKVEVRYLATQAGSLDATSPAPNPPAQPVAGHTHPPETPRPPAQPAGPVVLERGQAWSPPVVVTATALPETKAPRSSSPTTVAAATPRRAVSQAVRVAAAALPERPKSADTSAAFTEGMRLIERGDYAAGADKLDTYRRANPSEARAEDAAYLTILALQRAGRRDDARAAARRYLDQYPNGYRRAEAQRAAR